LRDAWGELARSLQQTAARLQLPCPRLLEELRALAQEPGRDVATFVGLLAGWRDAAQPDAACLMIIDQLEELLTAGQNDTGARFAEFVRSVLEAPGSPLMVLGTLRSDLLARFQLHPLGATAFDQIAIGPLTLQGFTLAIEEPARVAELTLEPGLVSQMVSDTGTEDALPLLAFTLRELWERYGDDKHLSLREYRDELGGLQGSLARAADTALRGARSSPAEELALRRAFLAMVRVNEDDRYVRRQALWSELPPESHRLLQRFVEIRLLVPRERDGASTLEVAHEALFRAWEKLRGWLDEDANSLRVQRDVRRAAADWQAANQEGGLLVHRGSRLDAAELMRGDGRFTLGELELAYLDACIELREREQSDQYLSCILLAQQNVRAARYDLALDWLWGCPERLRHWEWGYLLRLAYLELPCVTLGPGARDTQQPSGALPRSFDMIEWDWSVPEAPARVRTQASFGDRAFSRDGALEARRETYPRDTRVLHLIDTASGATVHQLRHDLEVRNASFSFDGARVVSAAGKDAYVWDCRSGRLLATLRGHTDDVWSVAFSPDGKRLISASSDNSGRVWDARSGRALVTLQRFADWRFAPVNRSDAMSAYSEPRSTWHAAAFSPDSTRIAIDVDGECLLFGTYPFREADLALHLGASFLERFELWRQAYDAARVVAACAPTTLAALDERPVIDVASAQELVQQLGSDRVLRLTAGAVYDVGSLPELRTPHVRYHEAHDGQTLVISDVTRLSIKSAKGERASIITPHAYAFVLQFERCNDVRLEGIVCGHAPERGGCDRGVIGAIDSFRLAFVDCELYGCGTEGLTFTNVHDVRLQRTVIRDCSYGILTFDHCNDVIFEACSLVNNEEFWGVRLTRTRDVLWSACVIDGNRANEPLFGAEWCYNVLVLGGRCCGNRASTLSSPDKGVLFQSTALSENSFDAEPLTG
jgi:hypothetical protein